MGDWFMVTDIFPVVLDEMCVAAEHGAVGSRESSSASPAGSLVTHTQSAGKSSIQNP